ncbi:hypothetical protein ELG77_35930 [Rhizobium leguminosarum]|uniref:hypothetical protein n=1 Tax=Rhizobium leguminosarum TaxID=384 RepID=UPI001031618E|nr:hypothetical protein [Rhizobium leguminosarum]TBF22555.1 hypothetical protein ELG92_36795 [Rhizobium leguminosarum]TBG28650.1 hypothetical protein ELG77_35930 [Rhizobium leguminosarum]
MKLRIGMHGQRTLIKNTRGKAFCGLGAFVGVGGTQRAHVYTAASLDEITPESHTKIDPVRLARELEVDMCAVNGGRIWLMDEQDVQGGDIVDFHGVKMMYGGEMTGAEMIAQMKNPYLPSLIYRNSNWIWHAGTPVHLLREPGGTVWVMQEYTKDVDPNLSLDTLDQVGRKLEKLPQGWTYETKVLERDLSLNTDRCDGWAAIIRDELHCTYQGCGYGADTSANYVP